MATYQMDGYTIKTSPVAHGLFGQYSYKLESVHEVYSDRGRVPGQFVVVGYVAKTRVQHYPGHPVEWVVKNCDGLLMESFGDTMKEAVLMANGPCGWLKI